RGRARQPRPAHPPPDRHPPQPTDRVRHLRLPRRQVPLLHAHGARPRLADGKEARGDHPYPASTQHVSDRFTIRRRETNMVHDDKTPTRIATTGITRRRFAQGLATAPLVLGAGVRGFRTARAQGKVKLVVLTHWGTKEQKDPLEKIFAEYTQANP